jgi:hypothetical protein
MSARSKDCVPRVGMPLEMPKLFVARHGDTAWTESHQRTGRTDIPLNEAGEERARCLSERLRQFSFTRVFTSPLQRASKTCELAGFGAAAILDEDLFEWDYGRFGEGNGDAGEGNRDAISFSMNPTLDGIREISLSPRSLIGSLSVGGLQDARSAPDRDLLPFRAPTSLRRMVVLFRCSPALGLLPSWSKER